MRCAVMLTITAALSALTCAPPPPADTAGSKAALREVDQQYSEAGTAQNREALLALYAPDAVIYPPAGAMVTGPDGMGAVLDAALSDPNFALSFEPVAVEVSTDGTMGFTLNTGQLTLTGPDGTPTPETFRDLHVWRKQADGSWKLTVDMWNHGAPPEEDAAN